MANTLNIGNATSSDLTNRIDDVTIDLKAIEGVQDIDETTYINSNFTKYWGYFNEIPDLKAAILMKAIWNVGKGYTADPATTIILDHISGWGKDTFKDILFNMEIMRRVGRESFAEIIRADDGTLINLKPLDPSTIKTIVGRNGMIKRYEQINKIQKTAKTFKPEEIFHLVNNRLADQIHGISDIESMEKTILADNESFTDMTKIMHRQARPMIMFKLGTDDQVKIDAFVAKMDIACNKGENIYIPDDANSVNYEVVQVNVSPLVLAWRDDMRKRFYRAIGLPELLPSGGGDATESGGKIGYLCFQQIVENDQSYIEGQVWSQLYLKINLNPPESLAPALQQDTSKDGGMAGLNMQPSDTNAGTGR